jgi:glycogen phosphorylase
MAHVTTTVVKVRAIRRFTVRPVLPESLRPLEELAANLRWSWHAETQDLFEAVDAHAWETSGHDPVRFLGAVSPGRLQALAADRRFIKRLRLVHGDLEDYLTGERWYQTLGPQVPRQIAYFSPEFGIAAVLPQYSGGLGILAGDHLKTASDLGVPIIGVGLLYRHGYFQQLISREGWQQERYPITDPDELPLRLLREEDGTVTHIDHGLPGGQRLKARIWVAAVGRVPLLLMDSDIEANSPTLREVTDRLYGGESEHRLHQEILLGVGGIRAIRAYCRLTGTPSPEVYHTNEGHAGFLGIERIREFVQDRGLDFDAALEQARAGTVFTTHTPVPAGIDRFPKELIQAQFGRDDMITPLPVDKILALGAEDYPGGDPAVFNMAVMGMRLAGHANGVSLLHGHVSRQMFAGLWPGFDHDDIPITSITNGVHAPTWVAPEIFQLADDESVLSEMEGHRDWSGVDTLPSERLWRTRHLLRARLVAEVRTRLRMSWLQRGATAAELGWVDSVLDPNVLTIGFARRVPSYKRLTLMMRDQERLKRLLLDPLRPVQIVIAGKAHPADEGGKKLIQEIVKFSDEAEVRHRIVFLPNYDIKMAQHLLPGCDVWLNNPLRPYEACGTSGMKAALNGCLNVSILDGWWDEWYDGDNGWSIPSADGIEDAERRDDIESAALYDLLENEVAPRFYDIDADNLPVRWLEMVRHTLKSLGPKVLATRMVRDYVRQMYTPATTIARRLDDTHAGAIELAAWKKRVRKGWPEVRIEHIESSGVSDAPALGSQLNLRVFAALGELRPQDVDVQVLHGRVAADDELRRPIVTSLEHALEYEGGRHRFDAEVSLAKTGPFGYTVRIVPRHDLIASSADLGLVAWPADLNASHEIAAAAEGEAFYVG